MNRENLCRTCWKLPQCLLKEGIHERETCDDHKPIPLNVLLERDEFIRDSMVGACPECGSENTCDSEDYPLGPHEDNTVGHCSGCGIYWCLECGYTFEAVRQGIHCPHWGICAQCSSEHGYLTLSEFMEGICFSCEYHDDGCQLEDPSQCGKLRQYSCPYECYVSECPRIEEFLG